MSYIFVGGSQRSGTSLLAASLCAGEETNPYLGESGSLRALLQVHSVMNQRYEDEMAFHFGSREVTDEYFGSCLRSYLSHTMAFHAPISSLVLKEPHLTMQFPLIWKLIPTAKFVMLIRDPRDIAASMLTVGEKLKKEGKLHLFNSGDIAKIANIIGQFYRPTLAAMKQNSSFSKSVFWVKYEDLVADPTGTIDQLRAFTGLKLELYDPADPTKRTHPAKVKSRKESARAQPWNSDLMRQKGISEKSKGSYKNKLTPKQIATIEQTLPGLFKRFKYTPESA
jgi:hypothetical protein